METDYSLKKIIKNRMGYIIIFILIFSIVFSLLILFLNFEKFTLIPILLFMICAFFATTIYVIANIIKIMYFFKMGIETKARIIDNTYIATSRRTIPFEYSGKELEQTGNISAYKKNGAMYEYTIDGQVYQSSSKFIMNSDTMSIKNGSIINVLVNPKNKNEAIIKDIFVK